MSDIVVVYHSGYGHTRKVAAHLAKAAEAELLAIDDNRDLHESAWDKLAPAKTIVFGAPTYMANVRWKSKKFADLAPKIWYTRSSQNTLYDGYSNRASPVGDKGLTLSWLQTLAAQHGGLWISLGMLPSNTKAAKNTDLNALGGSTGLLVQSPSDASVDEIPQGGLDTAAAFGTRIADITKKFV